MSNRSEQIIQEMEGRLPDGMYWDLRKNGKHSKLIIYVEDEGGEEESYVAFEGTAEECAAYIAGYFAAYDDIME